MGSVQDMEEKCLVGPHCGWSSTSKKLLSDLMFSFCTTEELPPSISKKLKLSIANLKRITVGMDEHGNLANALIFFPTTTISTSPADPKCLFIYAWVAFLSSFFFLSFFNTIFTFPRYDQTPSSIYVFLTAAEKLTEKFAVNGQTLLSLFIISEEYFAVLVRWYSTPFLPLFTCIDFVGKLYLILSVCHDEKPPIMPPNIICVQRNCARKVFAG